MSEPTRRQRLLQQRLPQKYETVLRTPSEKELARVAELASQWDNRGDLLLRRLFATAARSADHAKATGIYVSSKCSRRKEALCITSQSDLSLWIHHRVRMTTDAYLAELGKTLFGDGADLSLSEIPNVNTSHFNKEMRIRTWRQLRGSIFEWTVFCGLLRLAPPECFLGQPYTIDPSAPVEIELGRSLGNLWMWYQKPLTDKVLGLPYISDLAFTRGNVGEAAVSVEGVVECKSHQGYANTMVKDIYLQALGERVLFAVLAVDGELRNAKADRACRRAGIGLWQIAATSSPGKLVSLPRKKKKTLPLRSAMKNAARKKLFGKAVDSITEAKAFRETQRRRQIEGGVV
jgi:hypothetical protein